MLSWGLCGWEVIQHHHTFGHKKEGKSFPQKQWIGLIFRHGVKKFATALLVSHLGFGQLLPEVSIYIKRHFSPKLLFFEIKNNYLCFKTFFPWGWGSAESLINTVPHLEITWPLKISFLSSAACKKWHQYRKLTPWQTPTAPNGVPGLVAKLPKSHTLCQTKMCPE